MLALQIGSTFSPDSRLEKLYNGAKGAFNILKSGEKFCKKMQDFETALNNYDTNKENNLTEEQASSLFAIDILIQTLSLTNNGSILYSGFNKNDLVNGIKDYYAKVNETARTISSIDNYASVYVDFDQPFRWFSFATTPVKLELTATPVFTYADGYEFIPLKDVPKEYTDSSNINEKMIIMGSAKSDKTSFGSLDYRVRSTLKRGLYLLKATYKDTNGNDIEVFRDSIHVIQEAQEFTMMVNR